MRRRVAASDRRGVDDRGRGLAVEQELVEHRRELLDRAEVELDVEAVLTGDPQAFFDLGDLRRQLGDLRQLTDGGLDADDRGQLVAERARVDLGAVAGDHPGLLEAPDALGDRRRGQVRPAPELGERDAAIAGKLADDLVVDLVENRKIGGCGSGNGSVHKVDRA